MTPRVERVFEKYPRMRLVDEKLDWNLELAVLCGLRSLWVDVS